MGRTSITSVRTLGPIAMCATWLTPQLDILKAEVHTPESEWRPCDGHRAERPAWVPDTGANEGKELLKMCRHMLQIIKATFAEYNLVLNQSAGKTELAVHFASRSSELKAGIMVDSLERGIDHPTLGLPDGTSLIVSSTYLYLGRWTDPSCRQSKEIRCRKGQAMAAMRDLQPILKNADVPLPLK
eukprot:1185586-Amphidinium_carterae.1